MTPKGERYNETPRVSAFYQQVLERVRAEPGVASAGAITIRPLWSTVGYDWNHLPWKGSPNWTRAATRT